MSEDMSLNDLKLYIKINFKKGIYKSIKKELKRATNIVFHNKDNLIHRANFNGIAIDPTGISFYRDGLRHREDGPASILKNGDSFWYRDNILDRDDGPAEIKLSQAYACWYKNGVVHREYGPAIIFYKDKKFNKIFQEEYFINGIRHREDGPAVIQGKNKTYFYKGKSLSKKQYKEILKPEINTAIEMRKLKKIA